MLTNVDDSAKFYIRKLFRKVFSHQKFVKREKFELEWIRFIGLLTKKRRVRL